MISAFILLSLNSSAPIGEITFSLSFSITWGLWMMGPSVKTPFLFCLTISKVISIALFTPKQKPARFAVIVSNLGVPLFFVFLFITISIVTYFSLSWPWLLPHALFDKFDNSSQYLFFCMPC